MRILLDLDEVLADFVGGALAVHGWTRERLETVWAPGTWSIVEPMGLSLEEFWAPINAAGESFWVGLTPLRWAHDLLRLITEITDDWFIVSSPSQCVGAYSGKARWVQQFLGDGFDRLVITNHKHLLAKPGVILIDDREESVRKFIAVGGDGLTFPSRHNYLYQYANDPVSYLSHLFKERHDALQVQERQRCLPATRYGLR